MQVQVQVMQQQQQKQQQYQYLKYKGPTCDHGGRPTQPAKKKARNVRERKGRNNNMEIHRTVSFFRRGRLLEH